MIRLIACDLDETLLNDQHQLSKRNKEAIQQARAMGVKFVPASGRGFPSIQGILHELDLYDLPEEYVISYNGGAITENKGNHLLHLDGLSFDLVKDLFQRGLAYHVCIHIFTTECIYTYRMLEEERQYLDGLVEVTEFFTEDLSFLKQKHILKVAYMNLDASYLHEIAETMGDLKDQLTIAYSSNRYIEFNHQNVSKGQGLLYLMQHLQIPKEEVIAIGDNWNDASMLKAAGLGIGVQNCIPEMKALCDHITMATNNEDAVAEVIETYILGTNQKGGIL